MNKRILIFSGGGLDKMTESFERGFSALGCQTEIFFEDRPSLPLYFFKFWSRTRNTALALRSWDAYREANGRQYEEKVKAYAPDMIFMYNFNSVSSGLIKKITHAFKIKTAYLVMADPLVASEHHAYYADNLVECSHLFFINPSAIPSMRLISSASMHYLPLAADPHFYKPLNMKKDLDIILVGQFSSVSVATVTKAYLLNRLCEVGFRVSAAGAGLDKLVRLPQFPHLKKLDIITSSALPIEEVNMLYNRAKIVLAPEHPRDKDMPSPRAFEAAMAGSFPLADWQSEAESLFHGMLATFRTADEMVSLSAYYLKREREREQLARKIHEVVAREHTYLRRARTVLEKTLGLKVEEIAASSRR